MYRTVIDKPLNCSLKIRDRDVEDTNNENLNSDTPSKKTEPLLVAKFIRLSLGYTYIHPLFKGNTITLYTV